MFFLKTKIIEGRGSLEYLQKEAIGFERALILASSSMKRLGFLKEAEDYLREGGVEVISIAGLPPEPTKDVVDEFLPKVREFSPEILIAIGGGSVIDMAKALKVFYDVPGISFEEVAIKSRFSKPRPVPKLKTPLIAIPSTSGAGSEVSAASVIKVGDVKYTIVTPEIAPEVAILDPRLPEGMPPEVARNSGMDVLVHAIEAYVSKASSPFTDAMAVKAAKAVLEHLEESIRGDKNAREKIHYAATMAGIAFLNARLGLVHAMSHKAAWIGPHGLVNAILLPYVMEYNMARRREKYDALARELGFDNAEELLEEIKALNERLGIGPISSYVSEEEFLAKLDEMVERAYEDPLVNFNPVEPRKEDIRRIYERAFYGD